MQYKNNPLSPHLQIYKWQISSLLSIAHRIVGIINILGAEKARNKNIIDTIIAQSLILSELVKG